MKRGMGAILCKTPSVLSFLYTGFTSRQDPSVVDPDPYWIRIQELPGSGSVFGIGTDPDPHMQI